MRQHRVEKLVIRQARITEAELGILAYPSQRSSARMVMPMRAMSFSSIERLGGVLRYSVTWGSMPALRIIASVLREVPQSGLW